MSDSEDAVKILIEFGLDDAAARTALADMEKLKAAVAEGTEGVKNLGTAEGKGAEHAEHMHASHRALHMIMHQMGATEVPGLTQALMGMQMGGIGAVIAIAGAFAIWKWRIKEAQEALGGIAMPDLSEGISTLENLGGKWHGLADAVRSASDEYNGFLKIHQDATAALDAEAKATTALLDAKKKMELSALDVMRGNESISAKEYEVRKRIIEQGYTEENVKQQMILRDQKVEEMRKEKADADAEAADKDAQAKGMKGLGGGELTDEESKALIEKQKEAAKTMREEAKKQREAANIAYNAPIVAGGPDLMTEEGRAAAAKFGIIASHADLSKQGDSLNKSATAADKAAAEIEKRTSEEEKDLARRTELRQQAVAAKKESEKLAIQIKFEDDAAAAVAESQRTGTPLDPKFAASAAAKNANAMAVLDINRQTNQNQEVTEAQKRIKGLDKDDILTRGAGDLDQVNQLRQSGVSEATIKAYLISSGKRQELENLNDLLSTMGGMSQEVLKILAAHSRNQTNLAQEINALKTANQVVQNMIRYGGHTTPP